MGKSKAFPTHSSVENHNTAQLGGKGLKEGADGCSTPKIKLIFNLPGGCNGLAQRKWPPRSMATSNEIPTTQKSKRHQREGNIWKTTSTQGSIDNIVALKQTTHE